MTPYLQLCQSHLRRLISSAAETGCTMWPSVVDVRTGRCPEGGHVPRRVYRLIGAPRGSTLYWDQPSVVAACALSELTGDPHYKEAAHRYVDAFLSCCVSDNGMFEWGNHQYYDVVERTVVEFHNGYHELRPITPAWEVFWQRAPETTAAYLRTMARRHVVDPATGAFNRHDDGKKGHAFLEAGGILCESLAWLYPKTADPETLQTALKIARYSYGHRNRSTGLVPNEPDKGRWDSTVCTSEVGLWAQCLLRAWQYTGCDEFADMVREAVLAWLRHAWDETSGRYAGQVRIRDGKPQVPEQPGYWPGRFSQPWNTDQWPTHDYPMPLAQSCLTLHTLTGDDAFNEAARRWASIALETSPGRAGTCSYAENYGRCIHFLTRAAGQLDEPNLLADARTLADEAVEQLCDNGMVQGYPGSGMYESVDGVGFLLLALMALETGQPTEMYGFGF